MIDIVNPFATLSDHHQQCVTAFSGGWKVPQLDNIAN
jgi:hypothetical protein